jgi:anti-anti-sigma factor
MEVETVGEVTVVTLPTRVDTTSAGGVESEFRGLLEQGSRKLVADFSATEYVSSAGLRVFLSVLKALEKDGGTMVLCAMQPFVADVFEISGFSGLFTICTTREEALAAVA